MVNFAINKIILVCPKLPPSQVMFDISVKFVMSDIQEAKHPMIKIIIHKDIYHLLIQTKVPAKKFRYLWLYVC